MRMSYVPEQAKYEDGTPSPWWKIKIYKNGKLFDEYPTQYSDKWYVKKLCLRANLIATLQWIEDLILGIK